ncbi:MAG: PHP domain-containing protein [Clostridiales bacterium]|jgi:putative hydrolase|nr:PHP domain-containing protein [Clostridiales bacterium]
MTLYGDYHTHTVYSHGKGTVLENALAAAAAGLKQIAVTDHGFRRMACHMRRSEIPALSAEAREAERLTGVRVLIGVESNLYGPDGAIDVKEGDYGKLDIILCGFHKWVLPRRPREFLCYALLSLNRPVGGTRRQIERNTDMYLRALDRRPIDILTHLGLGARVDARRVAEKCAEHGTYIELNGKGISFSREEFLEMLDTPVMFIANSDAHSAGRVGDVSLPERFLEGLDMPPGRIANAGAEPPRFRSGQRR